MQFITKKTFYINDKRIKKYYFSGFLYLVKERSFFERTTFFLGVCVSRHKLFKNLLINDLGVASLFESAKPPKERHIDIIIPVYNGYEYLEDLFSSIYKNTDLCYTLFVVNDCSSDKRVLPLLKKWKNTFKEKMYLINNEYNLGFVQSVNKALKLTTHDVALINTDVILPPNWSSRLFYPIFMYPNVASATPFSNAATIFSIPRMNFNNLFDGNLENTNKKLSKLNIPYQQLKLPTGVGFCMAMSKDALMKIGNLDEIFEKGYGEENDWCQRAVKNGFINTVAGNLFVWHKHGGSFESKEKKQLIQDHIKILLKRYPHYNQDVQKTITNPTFLSLRFFSEVIYFTSICSKIQAWFDHTWGGGTEVYIKRQFEQLKNENLCFWIQNNETDFFTLFYTYQNFENKIIIHRDDLFLFLEKLPLTEIIINNLAGYKNVEKILDMISNLKKKTKAKVSFRGHDLQCICPSITMMNEKNVFCNCSDFSRCENCFKKIKNKIKFKIRSINQYQQTWKNFLSDVVDEIFVFSQSTCDLYTKYYPSTKQKMKIIPHVIPTLKKVVITPHKGINIAVLGNIGIPKGFLLLKKINTFLKKEYPDVKIIVIGTNYKSLSHITETGSYEIENLPDLMKRYQIDMVWIPSVWPETFSYTTSEAMSMGLPVACFNLGAPAERVQTYSKGLVIDKIDARYALNKIVQFCRRKNVSTD